MKNLMIIIGLLLFTVNLQAQSIARLEEKIETQKEKVEAQKKKVDQAEKAVQDEIVRGKKAAEEDPTAHGTNEELKTLKEELEEEKEQLEKEERKLKKLQDKLEKAQKKLKEKLKKAMEETLKKYPVPDDDDELDEYEEKMKKLETNPRNSELEKALRERIQKLIDAKRKELEEQGALPGQQNQGFAFPDTGWKKIASWPAWTLSIEFSTWFEEGETYPESYFENINESIYSDPVLFEKLFESLGGEFFLGTFSAPAHFMNDQYRQPVFFSVNGGYCLNRNLDFTIGFGKGRSSNSAEFPVSVIDVENGNTSSGIGRIEHDQSFFTASLKGKYTFGRAFLKPMLGVGIDYLRQTKSEVEAVLGGERMIIGTIDPKINIVTNVQAGLRMEFKLPIAVEVAAQARKLSGEIQGGWSMGVQYRFSR